MSLPYIHTAGARQLISNLTGIAKEFGRYNRIRSILLRVVAVFATFAIIFVWNSGYNSSLYTAVAISYLAAVIISAALVLFCRWHQPLTGLAILDAMLVTFILYDHILGTATTENHGLTTSSLVIAFVLLSHIGMSLNGRLVVIFSATVLAAWTAMLGVMALRHDLNQPGTFFSAFFELDLGLALSFGFAALSTYILAIDHDRTHKEALKIDQWRHNLARFFSPLVVADLQEAGNVLDLKRRPAAIMFVDLRDFTSYAETAPASHLAGVLAEYRRLVAGTVFAFGGTVDKFIGDGIMAVFGQPTAAEDDAARALACAQELIAILTEWKPFPDADGPVFRAGIGLHYGTVIGGVLESGYHDEFTVIGDAVNVAQRLEALTKDLDASLVVSSALLIQTQRSMLPGNWKWKKAVGLSGRRIPIDLAYLPRGRHPAASAADNSRWNRDERPHTAATIRQAESARHRQG